MAFRKGSMYTMALSFSFVLVPCHGNGEGKLLGPLMMTENMIPNQEEDRFYQRFD